MAAMPIYMSHADGSNLHLSYQNIKNKSKNKNKNKNPSEWPYIYEIKTYKGVLKLQKEHKTLSNFFVNPIYVYTKQRRRFINKKK